MNAVRIGLTGILTAAFGSQVAQGFFHGFSGWVLFIVAIGMLFLLSRILDRFGPKAVVSNDKTIASPLEQSTATTGNGKTTFRAFLLSCAILSCVAVFGLSTSTLPPMILEGGIQSFPSRIGAWTGSSERVDPIIIKESGAEEAFNGNFRNASGDSVSLYMGYRSTAFLSNENFFHSPTVCMPSSGWVEQEITRRTVKNVERFNDLEVTEMIVERAGKRLLVYFWFQTKSKATYDKNINRFHLSLHAIRRDNTYDLFMRPITPIYTSEKLEDAEKRLDGFVRDMMPVLLQFMQEKQVKS
jgi:EpsI family protein